MVIPVARGMRYDRFAIINDGDPKQPPVIDVLAPSIDEQRRALSDYDTRVERLAAVPAMAPSGRAAVGDGTIRVATSRPSSLVPPTEQSGGSGAWTTSPPPATPTPPPEASSEFLIAGPDGEPRRTIPARLKTLNALRADGLITEDEYQELRLKLLSEI
jgi:hypothetical protein